MSAVPRAEVALRAAAAYEPGRGEKIIVFRYKSKVRYRRKTGHRQALTRLRITDILLGGASVAAPAREPLPAAPEPEPVAAAPEATAAPRRRRAAAKPEAP